jgi:hypothetical protein
MDMASALVWGMNEFCGASLGDVRRGMRAARMAAGMLCDVGSAVSSSCGGSGAQAVSRLFDREEVTEASMLSKHIQRTVERTNGQQKGRILVVQDTTVLDFSARSNISGLGHTSMNGGSGILMHSALVMNEEKLPLGVLGLRLWTRDNETIGIGRKTKVRHTVDKESAKWLWGLNQVRTQLAGVGREIVLIGDRESDMYDLFADLRPSHVHILARISNNRLVRVDGNLDKQVKIFDALDASPVIGSYELELPKEKRTANLDVRHLRVVLNPPKGYKLANSGSVMVWVVDIREKDAPAGVEPLHWRLMTSLYAGSLSECLYIANCYTVRWSIEEFHRTLKTGCKVERLQLERVSRLRPAIALYCVVAYQVMYLTRYARSNPEAPVTNVATEDERETVESWVRMNRFATYSVQTASDYVRGIGFIGGFRGRKNDGEPGMQAIWQGLRNLTNLVSGRKIERLRAART